MALEIRVLVVEDDPETRLLTEALLSGRKGVCLCALAKDGLEGLELVEQTRPDIVLLDLILPGMDGLDFLRALRRRSARPAVVVASQASEPTVISRPGPAGSIRPSWAAFRPNGPATSSFSAGWPGGFWSGSATFPLKSDRHSAIL